MINFKSTKKPQKPYYPRLMISPKSESVYMMTGKGCGMKLSQGNHINSHHPVGEYRTDWTDRNMVDYVGDIVITAEDSADRYGFNPETGEKD